MAELTVNDLSMLKGKAAFVVGYTGEVGKELIKELLEKNIFKQLILIGRRNVTYEDPIYANAEQKVVNFDELDNHKDAFKNCDVGFCCLGTTRSSAGAAGFVKVDHDYVVNVAKVAHETGCQHFTVVSSQGADKNGLILYNQTKGLMEQHVSEIPFQRVSIMRPAFLLCERQGPRRIMESVGKVLFKPIIWGCPTLLSVPTITVAKAMIYNLVKKPETSVEIIDNRTIHQLGANYDKLFEQQQQQQQQKQQLQ